MRTLLLMITTTLLVACNPGKPETDDREKVDITTENTVLSFSSEAQGDYPVVTNLSLNNPVSAHPIVATIPELFKLEQAGELEQYMQSSQALGFDREAFDSIYAVTWEVLESIRYSFAEDVFGGLVSYADDIPEHLNIKAALNPGERGKGKRFTYTINQNYESDRCEQKKTSCDYHVDVEISFYFPDRGYTVNPYQSPPSVLVIFEPMEIQLKKLLIRNDSATLDLSVDGANVITTNFHELFFEDFSGGYNTALNESVAKESNNFGVQGLKGTFTNNFIDNHGAEKTIALTGHIHAEFPEYSYLRNFSSDDYTYPSFTEQDKPVDERSQVPLSMNTMTGHLWNVDVEVQFATDITE